MKKKLTPRQKELKKEKILKKKLEKEADKLWHEAGKLKWGDTCFFHNSDKKGNAHSRKVRFGHHIKAKSLYPNMRYNLDNFLNVCWSCHYKLEKVDRSMILDVIVKRGKKWYNVLEREAKKKIKPSFKNIEWYKKNIKRLNRYIKKHDNKS